MVHERSAPEPFLFVHGLIGTLRDLVPFFEARGLDAHAPDLLGYGEHKDVPPDEIGLYQQVAHLVRWMDRRGLMRVRLVGHSVGGAVAMLFAHLHPEKVVSVINVEGNFSLADAFWSARVARMTMAEAEEMMTDFRGDPARWLARSGILPEPHLLASAQAFLANQPGSTVQAVARSVVQVTGGNEYACIVKSVFEGSVPVHLVGGARSRSEWDVPLWAVSAAASETVLSGGHLMMLEDPERFASTVSELG